MKHYFLDTNVVLDYLAERQPFWPDAAELIEASLAGQVRLYVASLSFANIYYTLRRATSATRARQLVTELETLVVVLGVDVAVVRQALTSDFVDFEDGLQHFAALAEPAVSAIITRDLKDFRFSSLPVISPAQALLEIDAYT